MIYHGLNNVIDLGGLYPLNEHQFTIMAADPSSHFVGIAVLIIDSRTMEIDDIKTHLINLRSLDVGFDTYSPMVGRIRNLGQRINPLLVEFRPKVFAHERAFANSKTPGAFEPLVSSITIMINSVLNFNSLTQISTFSPGQVKNAMGQKGNCKKEEMKQACKVDKRLNTFVNANLISEHEIDAIAIGLCCLDMYRNIKILLL